eukprot:2629730-Amphidinium_carterae.1
MDCAEPKTFLRTETQKPRVRNDQSNAREASTIGATGFGAVELFLFPTSPHFFRCSKISVVLSACPALKSGVIQAHPL